MEPLPNPNILYIHNVSQWPPEVTILLSSYLCPTLPSALYSIAHSQDWHDITITERSKRLERILADPSLDSDELRSVCRLIVLSVSAAATSPSCRVPNLNLGETAEVYTSLLLATLGSVISEDTASIFNTPFLLPRTKQNIASLESRSESKSELDDNKTPPPTPTSLSPSTCPSISIDGRAILVVSLPINDPTRPRASAFETFGANVVSDVVSDVAADEQEEQEEGEGDDEEGEGDDEADEEVDEEGVEEGEEEESEEASMAIETETNARSSLDHEEVEEIEKDLENTHSNININNNLNVLPSIESDREPDPSAPRTF